MNTHVRRLTVDDLYDASEYGSEFFDKLKYPGSFNPKVWIDFWTSLIGYKMGAIFGLFDENEKIIGALGGISAPDPNDGMVSTMELFWYVREEHRGSGLRLLNEYEKWAKSIGAKRIFVAHLANISPEGVKDIYRRRGYREMETHYVLIPEIQGDS